MSLHPRPFPPLPENTARVARQVFRKGHLYLTIGDQIGQIFSDEDWQDLYATVGAPGYAPAQLILVLIFQSLENLSDREAADAVRGRIEWKYALHLELEDPGFDFSVLSQLRERIVTHQAIARVLDRVLARMRALGFLSERGRQRTDSTYVLGAPHALNRLELVMETVRLALEEAVRADPAWVQRLAWPEWAKRYALGWRSKRMPTKEAARTALAAAVGRDGAYLLACGAQEEAPAGLLETPTWRNLAQIWAQQYEAGPHGWQWRPAGQLPPGAKLIGNPHDVEMRYAQHHNGQAWEGYKVHSTETCDSDQPRLITHVAVAPATEADLETLPAIHQGLAQRDCLPGQHLIDCGYTSSDLLESSLQEYGVTLIGPVAKSPAWQAREAGSFTAEMFTLDWEQRQARCPAGRTSPSWKESQDETGHAIVRIRFPTAVCQACPSRAQCTRAKRGRALKVQPSFATLTAARQRQQTEAFQLEYAPRAGIEGTIGEAVRAHGARVSRYLGQAKTCLQETLLAAAINLERSAHWLQGDRPETTRISRFMALASAKAMVG